ncbi:MAG: hypothetical protein ACK5L5_04045 [Bacteroidales bacterium]
MLIHFEGLASAKYDVQLCGMRDHKLKIKRNQRIVEMFHEMYDKKRMRLDDVLEQLSEEYFFLTTDYIYAIVFYNEDGKAYYNQLLEEKTT